MFDTLKLLRFRRVELNPVVRRLSKAVSVADLRLIARKRSPRGVFDYIDGGAEDELTLASNIDSYRRVEFRPRVLRDVAEVDTTTSLLGKPLSLPLVLAPTGFTRIADPVGELAVARSAARAGIPYSLSTLGTRSIEEVAAVSSGRLWFQVYMWRDRALVRDLIHRAAESGYEALCLTVDTAVLGRRERDVRRGFTLPPKLGVSTIFDGLIHPGWTLRFVGSEPITFANVVGSNVGDGTAAISLAETSGVSSTRACRGKTSSGYVVSGAVQSSSRESRQWKTRRSPPASESTRSPSPTTAVGNSTLRPQSSNCCPRLPMPSVMARNLSATAASGEEATSSRRWRSEQQLAWLAEPTYTGWEPRENAESTMSSTCSRRA